MPPQAAAVCICGGAPVDGIESVEKAPEAWPSLPHTRQAVTRELLVQESYVKDLSEVVKSGQAVHVRVMSVDNGRISLTMKAQQSEGASSDPGARNGAEAGGDERPRLGKVATRGGAPRSRSSERCRPRRCGLGSLCLQSPAEATHRGASMSSFGEVCSGAEFHQSVLQMASSRSGNSRSRGAV